MRTKEWPECFRRIELTPSMIAAIVEPGDATHYCVLLCRVNADVADVVGENAGWLYALTNFGSRRAMYVREGRTIRYEDVRDGMGVTASSSAQFLCELVCYLTGGAVHCETWEAFEERLARAEERAERAERKEREKRERDKKMRETGRWPSDEGAYEEAEDY